MKKKSNFRWIRKKYQKTDRERMKENFHNKMGANFKHFVNSQKKKAKTKQL